MPLNSNTYFVEVLEFFHSFSKFVLDFKNNMRLTPDLKLFEKEIDQIYLWNRKENGYV